MRVRFMCSFILACELTGIMCVPARIRPKSKIVGVRNSSGVELKDMAVNDSVQVYSDSSKESNVTILDPKDDNRPLIDPPSSLVSNHSKGDPNRNTHSIGFPDAKKEFPVALVTASALAAVFIITFICVAYYCHSRELDSMKKQLALEMASEAAVNAATSDNIKGSESQALPIIQTPGNPVDVNEINDQQLLHYAGRRRSTFIF